MTTLVDVEQLKKMDKQNISDVGILNSTYKGEVVAQLINFKHNGIFHMTLAYDYLEAFGHHHIEEVELIELPDANEISLIPSTKKDK